MRTRVNVGCFFLSHLTNKFWIIILKYEYWILNVNVTVVVTKIICQLTIDLRSLNMLFNRNAELSVNEIVTFFIFFSRVSSPMSLWEGQDVWWTIFMYYCFCNRCVQWIGIFTFIYMYRSSLYVVHWVCLKFTNTQKMRLLCA